MRDTHTIFGGSRGTTERCRSRPSHRSKACHDTLEATRQAPRCSRPNRTFRLSARPYNSDQERRPDTPANRDASSMTALVSECLPWILGLGFLAAMLSAAPGRRLRRRRRSPRRGTRSSAWRRREKPFPRKPLPGRIGRIVDGDSIEADVSGFGRPQIRLANVDAPENDQPWGREAREALSRLVRGTRPQFRLLYRDRYRRTAPVRRPKLGEAAKQRFHRTHRRVAAGGSQGRASQAAAHREAHLRASSRRARLHRRVSLLTCGGSGGKIRVAPCDISVTRPRSFRLEIGHNLLI